MKVFISVDLEGIGGIVHSDQCSPGTRQYDEACAFMTGEANAAISGAFEGGASELVVNDAHGAQRNVSLLDLDPRARLITGSRKPLSMMEGVDESFDAAFFIGYHAGAGSYGVLSHTYDSPVWAVRLNSQSAGEITINAALAGYYGVPVALVTGDSAACREALSILGEVEAVSVKEPVSRYSANCWHPTVVRDRIKSAAKSAANRVSELEPFTLEPPIRFELTFTHPGYAERANLMPGTTRTEPVVVTYESDDFVAAYRGFLTMLALASSIA